MKTYKELEAHLLNNFSKATSEKSKANPSFTKEDMWNHYAKMCLDRESDNLPIKTAHILIKNVKKDF